MTKIICIVGLPGSGKTFTANMLAGMYLNALVIDDIRNQAELPANDVYSEIIITDPYFCLSLTREYASLALSEKYSSVEWIFFENNIEKCLKNIRYRADGRKVENLINFLHENYVIPISHTPLEIWQPAIV